MVTARATPSWVAAVRRVLTLLIVVTAAALGPAAVAAAQPTDTTFGFNEACDQIHDTLDDIGIPGTPFNLGNAASGVCKAGNVATHPGETVEAVKDKAWDSTFGEVVDSMLTGLGEAIILSLTFWAKVPNSAVDDLPALMTKVRDYTDDIQIYLLAASLMAVAVRLMFAKANAAADEATQGFKVLFRTVFASSLWALLIVMGTRATDAFSAWVIDDATNGNAKGVAEAIVQTQALAAFSPGLIVIFAVVGLLSALLQIVLALIRQGLLCVVAGVLPLAAAASGTASGEAFYKKLLMWSIAFILYKPIAALAYMIAFTVAGDSNVVDSNTEPTTENAVKALVGIALLCSVAFVLPAIMRLLSPVTAMGGGASGAGVSAAMVGGASGIGMAGRLASGAADSRGGGTVSTSNHSSSSSSAGGSRPSGAAPATARASGAGSAGGAGTSGSPGSTGASRAGSGSAARSASAGAGSSGAAAAGGGAAASSGAAAGGPYVAAAQAGVQAAGAGIRAADNSVNQAADSGGGPHSAPPSGAGPSQAVPR
ncbi:hypothetical protein [Nocardia salmonicida]|uniref:hypothetical protein n=1 Tax=Nocardia salmonicida TaxID=53431 RepID=UPI0037AAB76E